MPVQNASKIIVAAKAQTGLGTAASGAGAFGLEVTPSQGTAMQVAAIESQLIQRSRMRKKPRHGSRSVSGSYETELMVGSLHDVQEAVMGGTWAAAQTLDHTTLTSATISDSGATITFAGGNLLTSGVRVGMMARFADMSVTENNNVWFPILAISGAEGRVWTTDATLLADNTADTAFSVTIARSLATTAAGYVDRYFTVEEWGLDVEEGKLITDARWNQLSVSVAPDGPARVSLGLGARNMAPQATSPNFTSPVFTEGDPLILRDGGVYVNGVKKVNLTGITAGLAAPVSHVPVIGATLSPDVFLGQFAFTGEFTGVVQDYTDFTTFTNEDQISVLLHFAERDGSPADFESVYFGNLSFGGYSSPAGGEGALIQTIPLWGGSDERGTQYAATTALWSTSHTPA